MTLLRALVLLLVAAAAARAEALTLRAGVVTHTLTGYTVLREIPASWTIPRFENIAKAWPAPAGQVWYVLRGTVTNGASEERAVNSLTFRIRDPRGGSFKPNVHTSLYQGEDTNVARLPVPPGESRHWAAFFPVPAGASGLVLEANDLTFGSEQVARFRLPDAVPDDAAAAATADAPAARPASAPAAAAAAPAASTAGGPPQMTAAEFFRDYNSLKGAALFQKYKNGVIVSGPVLKTINEMDGSHKVWLDAAGGNYVTLSFADKGAAAVAKGIKKGDQLGARCDVGGGIGNYIMVLRCALE